MILVVFVVFVALVVFVGFVVGVFDCFWFWFFFDFSDFFNASWLCNGYFQPYVIALACLDNTFPCIANGFERDLCIFGRSKFNKCKSVPCLLGTPATAPPVQPAPLDAHAQHNRKKTTFYDLCDHPSSARYPPNITTWFGTVVRGRLLCDLATRCRPTSGEKRRWRSRWLIRLRHTCVLRTYVPTCCALLSGIPL